MLKKSFRIKKRKDFQNVFENGSFFSGKFIKIKFIKNSLDYSRLSVVIPKKNIRLASHRNRLKRQISEIIRLSYDKIVKGYDILVFYKNSIDKIDYLNVKKDFVFILDSCNLSK